MEDLVYYYINILKQCRSVDLIAKTDVLLLVLEINLASYDKERYNGGVELGLER